MEIAERTATTSHSNYDRMIMLGYVAFAVIALVAIYFACSGPGLTETDLANGLLMP
jgi:hypothetical protein